MTNAREIAIRLGVFFDARLQRASQERFNGFRKWLDSALDPYWL